MKIFKVLFIVLSLSFGYIIPAFSTPSYVSLEQQDVQKKVRKGPHHHRGMSKAMMNELNLNDKQKAQWQEISAQQKKETAALREQIKKLQKQEHDINKKYEAKIKKILTAEQVKKYESMLPKKMEKPQGKPKK